MICAVIVSYNSDKVFRCFESVKDQVDRVIIVDNASRDEGILSKLRFLGQKRRKSRIQP